jgi:hypothetical protein
VALGTVGNLTVADKLTMMEGFRLGDYGAIRPVSLYSESAQVKRPLQIKLVWAHLFSKQVLTSSAALALDRLPVNEDYKIDLWRPVTADITVGVEDRVVSATAFELTRKGSVIIKPFTCSGTTDPNPYNRGTLPTRFTHVVRKRKGKINDNKIHEVIGIVNTDLIDSVASGENA